MSVWPSLLKPQAVATIRPAPRHNAVTERGKHVGFITLRTLTLAEETVGWTTRRRASLPLRSAVQRERANTLRRSGSRHFVLYPADFSIRQRRNAGLASGC